MKACTKCGQTKQLTEFFRDSTNPSGYCAHCKVCKRASETAHRKTVKGKASKASADKRYLQSDKGKAKHAVARRKLESSPKGKLAKSARQRKRLNTLEYKASQAKYRQSPKGKASRNFHSTQYRAAKLQRMPSWLTNAQLTEIGAFYALAQELQILNNAPFEVDHIIPLQGENVSGLHVPWNLQILPQDLNRSKGNRLHSKFTSVKP